MLKLIVAVNELGFIGKDGKMLWRSKDDLKHFKELTTGCKLLVGRTTFEGLPPLSNRELFVVGSNHLSLEEALAKKPDWIIGGSQIYDQTVHLCDEIHISHINDNSAGDASFSIPDNYSGKIIDYYYSVNK